MKLPFDRRYFNILFSAVFLMAAAVVIFNAVEVSLWLWNIFCGICHLAAPLIIAVIIAFLLEPSVCFFEKRIGSVSAKPFKKRIRGTLAAYICVFMFIAAVIYAVFKSAGAADITNICDSINKASKDFLISVEKFQLRLNGMGVLSGLNSIVNALMNRLIGFLKGIAPAAAYSVSSAGSMAVNTVLGMAAAFYFLSEKEYFLYRLKDVAYTFLNKKYAHMVIIFFGDINTVFSGYVSGQLTDAAIMAVLFSAAFWLCGIKYAFVIGSISGFFNLIPYVGAAAAFFLSVFTALVSGSVKKAFLAAVSIIIIQQIDTFIIVPRVVGKSVKLHPVMVMFSLSVFGNLFGILGMLFAVPVASLLKLNFDRIYRTLKIRRKNNSDS